MLNFKCGNNLKLWSWEACRLRQACIKRPTKKPSVNNRVNGSIQQCGFRPSMCVTEWLHAITKQTRCVDSFKNKNLVTAQRSGNCWHTSFANGTGRWRLSLTAHECSSAWAIALCCHHWLSSKLCCSCTFAHICTHWLGIKFPSAASQFFDIAMSRHRLSHSLVNCAINLSMATIALAMSSGILWFTEVSLMPTDR